MKSFSNETLSFSFSEISVSPTFWILPKLCELCKPFRRIHRKLCNERLLSPAEPCTCEYVTLLQSFHKGTLSIYWYIAQNFQLTFSISVLFRRLFRTAIFSRLSKVAIAMSSFMKEFYNGGFGPEFSVSMLNETIALV